jgi:hypothetical protein
MVLRKLYSLGVDANLIALPFKPNAKGHSAQPVMFWRTHHITPTPYVVVGAHTVPSKK